MSQCVWWEVTLKSPWQPTEATATTTRTPAQPVELDRAAGLCEWMTKCGIEFAFQLEEGDGGYRHYQMTLHLGRKKKRQTEMVRLLKAAKTPTGTSLFRGAHLSPSSKEHCNFSYSWKEDTRISGPWLSTVAKTKQTEAIVRAPKPPALTRLFPDPLPWQCKVMEELKSSVTTENWRQVNVITDPDGELGKTVLAAHIRKEKLGRFVPCVKDSLALNQVVFEWPSSAYVFDIPRGDSARARSQELYAAIESIKTGYVVELRYKPRELELPEIPHIWVFTNETRDALPISALTKDRWRFWRPTPDRKDIELY